MSEREEGALVLQEGCEFAEELLHKENVPHCLQGDGIARWSRVFFHLLIWFLNGCFMKTVGFELAH